MCADEIFIAEKHQLNRPNKDIISFLDSSGLCQYFVTEEFSHIKVPDLVYGGKTINVYELFCVY